MINIDEDAIICDFAETYHIYDYVGDFCVWVEGRFQDWNENVQFQDYNGPDTFGINC